jgi:2-dehydro-3-deoxygluconokinase
VRIVSLGEAMIELRDSAAGCAIGFGGDTLNTAIHLARFGRSVRYATALGEDPYSVEMKAAWQREGIDTGLVLTDPTRRPGLYAIRTDANGERRFYYWRDHSAARQIHALSDTPKIESALAETDLLYFSLISLAILPAQGREWLLAQCRAVRSRGGRVAFDGNYRPALWSSSEEAREWRDAALTCTDFGLPTLADEQMLDPNLTAESVRSHWSAAGISDTVVKLGADGCLLNDGTVVAPTSVTQPLDTSGAGDSFNAGYLHGRLRGDSAEEAARRGHALAGWVIQRSGAIPAKDAEFDYSA